MVYVLLGCWAVSAPFGIDLCEVQKMGVTGVWIGLAAGTLVTAALTIARLLSGRHAARRAGTDP
jgi:Na+-driven multidrug efflux pump